MDFDEKLGFADAITQFSDQISSVIARGERAGLTKHEILEELCRIIGDLEKEE